MALRSGYKGFKKLLPGLKIIRPGTLGIDNDILIPELNKTFFPRSEQAIVGAVNLMPGNMYELNTVSAEVGDSTFTTYAGVQSFIAPIKRNTTYTLSRAAGNRFRVALSNSFPANGVDCKVLINADINKYTFNSGDYDYVFVMLNAGSETYDNIKPVLNVGSVVSSFVHYAMTNRELTDEIPVVTDIKADSSSSVATINSLFISKVGKIAYVSGVVTLTSNVAAGGELLTLPPEYAIYQTDGNSGRYLLIGSNGATTIYHLYVQPSAGTKIFLAESANSGASIRFGGIYLLN